MLSVFFDVCLWYWSAIFFHLLDRSMTVKVVNHCLKIMMNGQ